MPTRSSPPVRHITFSTNYSILTSDHSSLFTGHGALTGTFTEVSCSQWSGSDGGSLFNGACLSGETAGNWPAVGCGNKGVFREHLRDLRVVTLKIFVQVLHREQKAQASSCMDLLAFQRNIVYSLGIHILFITSSAKALVLQLQVRHGFLVISLVFFS